MVARVVRREGKLVIELGEAEAHSLAEYEGRAVDLEVSADRFVVVPGVSEEFIRGAREILARHASTFEKLSK